MSLLALEQVSKRYRDGRREQLVLSRATLELSAGEVVFIYGARRSGRTTLLRIAAGIDRPDSGRVLFDGHDLAPARERTLGTGIGYMQKTLRSSEEQGVIDQVAAPLFARGVPVRDARERARVALSRAGAERCCARRVTELGGGEIIRVALARTIALSPRLIVLDEPAAGVELSERDEILTLLRALAAEGVAVLASTGEPAELAGAHRALTLSDGELHGQRHEQLAQVVALRRRSV